MWSVFIVKFLISVRSLDGFSPSFSFFPFPCSSEIPWRRRRAVGAPASPGVLPCSPRSKSTGNQPPVFKAFPLFSPFCPSLWAFSSPQQFPLSLSSLGAFWDLCHLLLLCAKVKVHGVDDHSHEHHKSHQILSKDVELSMSCLEKWDTASGLTELVASLVFQKFWIFQFDFLH